MKRSPTTTNSPSRRTRFLACVEQRIAAGHSISGQASLSHLPTTSQTQTPPCFALLLRVYLETKPPSGKKKTLATPPDGLTAVLKVPRKQRCTHLHFSRTFFFHLAVSQASVCVWGFFFLLPGMWKTMRGFSVSPFTLLWQYLLTNMGNWLFQTAWHERSFYHNADIRLMKKTEKKNTGILCLRPLTLSTTWITLPVSPQPATHTNPHIDAQEHQTNSGFLKAPVKGALLSWQTSINLVFSYARFPSVKILLELFFFFFNFIS